MKQKGNRYEVSEGTSAEGESHLMREEGEREQETKGDEKDE